MARSIGAVVISKLIDAHMKNDNEKFLLYANFIADGYEEKGDKLGAKIIRDTIEQKPIENVVSLDEEVV